MPWGSRSLTRFRHYQRQATTPPKRSTTRQISSTSRSSGIPARPVTNQLQAKQETHRLSNAAAALHRVQRAYHSGGVSGPGIDAGEAKYYKTLGKLTGLSPRVLAAQGTQEGGADEDYNVLNIGRTDSGDLPISHDPRFSRPKSGAKLTANFLKGKEGGASQGIRNILSSAGKSAGEQVKAIAGSGWATDPNYFAGISRALPSIKETPGKKPSKKDLKTVKKAGVSPKQAAKPKTQSKRNPASVAELFYDPGISLKDGSPIGSIGGHSDHVHVASNDPRAEKKFINIARNRFGLHVGENVFAGDTPEPGVHVSDSYHYREGKLPSGRAIDLGADVSGDASKMAAFDAFIAKKFGGNPQAGSGGSVTGAGGFSGTQLSTYAQATGMSIKGAKAVAKKNPNLIKQKLAKIEAAYDEASGSSSSSTSGGLSALKRRHSKPVV